MKAVRFSRFGGPEVLEIVDLPDPHPGPGEIRIAVRAAGVNASDWKKRKGLMDPELPQTLGHEAAGVVDELGDGVIDVAIGDRVFGFNADGAAQAELAVLSDYAPIPPSLDFPEAAALPAAIETATRALDQLGVGSGTTLLINGASGSVGGAAVQLAVARGVQRDRHRQSGKPRVRSLAGGRKLQRQLWGLAGEALAKAPIASAPRLYVETLNTMIDQQTVRVAALNNRVPGPVLAVEVIFAAAALGLLAFYLAILGRGVLPVLLAAGLVCLLLFVTFDLDRPTRGLINVPATPLTSLRASMELPPAAAAPSKP